MKSRLFLERNRRKNDIYKIEVHKIQKTLERKRGVKWFNMWGSMKLQDFQNKNREIIIIWRE